MPLFSGILGPFNTILYDKIWCKNTNPRHFTLISSEPRVGGSSPFRRTTTSPVGEFFIAEGNSWALPTNSPFVLENLKNLSDVKQSEIN